MIPGTDAVRSARLGVAVWGASGVKLAEPLPGTIEVTLTGELCVQVGRDVVPSKSFPGRQGRLMFAYLAAHHRPVARDELAEALWPAGPSPNWKRDLSALASRLRALLTRVGLSGPEILVGTGDWYELRLPDTAVVDLDVATDLHREAVAALSDEDIARALGAAREAIGIARRRFMPGEDGEWIERRRRSLERVLLGALEVVSAAHEQRGDIAAAREAAVEAVELAPFAENGYARLMRLQLAAGERADALRTFHRCRKLLGRELGVDPGPEVQAAYLEVLRSNLGPAYNAAPVLDSAAPLRSTLPVPADRFLGRDAELEAVASALGTARLVTLTGVGGVGKSRLALEAALRLAPAYADGARQCELSPIAAARDVAHSVATDLGVAQESGVSTEESLVRYLRDRRLLLIVDNCEHVIEAVTSLLATLLQHCPHISVLATSRERLGVGGEHVIEVPPLSVPTAATPVPASVAGVPAVELFAVRAAAVQAGFAVTAENVTAVAEICRRLDGLPLAIELAAARVAVVGVHEMATRLNQRFWLLRGKAATRPARSQSIQATVDWSYGMLTADQQRTFDRLSVFAGRFTLAATETICRDVQMTPNDVANAVLGLAEKSMVVVDMTAVPARYRLLETLREYGRTRLELSGDAAPVYQRHAAYFVAETERLARQMQGPDEAAGVAAFDACFDDVRAAHRWCLAHRDVDLTVRLSGALYWYGLFHQRAEVFAWAEESLPLGEGHPALPFACATAGVGAWSRGDRARAVELGRHGLAAAVDASVGRLALDVLASVAFFEGRLDEAAQLWEQALAAGRRAGDHFHASHMAGNAALAHGYQGHRDDGRRLAALADEIARGIGNPTARAWALYVSGEILMDDDPDTALPRLNESVRLARAVENRFVLGVALLSASSLRGRHGDPSEAIPMMLEAIRHWQRAGNWTQQWTTLRNVVELFVRLGADEPAAVLMGAIEAASTAAPVFGPDAERLTAARRTLSTRLGSQPLMALTARGATMEPHSVVHLACAELTRGPALTL
jgi:predicted ATPase/DNA-binding SARP family transcriptional activator